MILRPVKDAIHSTFRAAAYFGIDGLKAVRTITGLPRFVREVTIYRSQQNGRFPFHWKYARPILDERDLLAGTAEGQYFHQDLWAAREIFRANPTRHVDIGSRIDGVLHRPRNHELQV